MRNKKEKSEFNYLSLIPAAVLFFTIYPSLEKGFELLTQACLHTSTITISILF